MRTVDIDEAKSRLSAFVQAALRGEEVITTNRDRPAARCSGRRRGPSLRPYTRVYRLRPVADER